MATDMHQRELLLARFSLVVAVELLACHGGSFPVGLRESIEQCPVTSRVVFPCRISVLAAASAAGMKCGARRSNTLRQN